MRRGEASPPRKEPRIEVGVLTVLVIVPTTPAPLETSALGCAKFGWFRILKNCAPTLNFASWNGMSKFLVMVRSVSVYAGPVSVFLRCEPNLLALAKFSRD